MATDRPVIEVERLCTRFDRAVIHDGVNLSVRPGEVLALVGGSGSGKTTLLQEMIMLRRPTSGSIKLFGEEVVGIAEASAQRLRRRFGVLFQHGALFSGLNVLQNVMVPLNEHTDLSMSLKQEIAFIKIQQAGLGGDAAYKYPRELSGGMIKRAALARAMALDPQLLFLDEPTSGLDPVSADAFDELVVSLKEWLGLTILMITHDLDSLWQAADRVAVLGDKRLVAVAPMEQLKTMDLPAVRAYFSGRRGVRAMRV